jgi:hypothetical protein
MPPPLRLVSPGRGRGGYQPSLFDVSKINARQFEPVTRALRGASAFTGGTHSIAGLENVRANSPFAFRVQAAYRRAANAPESSSIRRSYGAMREEVGKQYEHMTRPQEEGGMGIRHEVVQHDPYESAEQMAKDVAGGRIKTLASTVTGPHAFFSPEENDRFRAIHDVFGHAATGRDFSRHGEEAAYLSHRQMFSRRAQEALASETRGQNAVLNYGPTKEFPEQAQGLVGMPAFTLKGRKLSK